MRVSKMITSSSTNFGSSVSSSRYGSALDRVIADRQKILNLATTLGRGGDFHIWTSGGDLNRLATHADAMLKKVRVDLKKVIMDSMNASPIRRKD